MSIKKLANSTVGLVRDFVATKGQKIAQAHPEKAQAAQEYIQKGMDVLSVQGQAMVKKFDEITNRAASKLDDVAQKIRDK